MLPGEPLDDRPDPRPPRPDAPPRLGDVAARQPATSASRRAVLGGAVRSRGPAHTTSSAGQPAQANSLGVGRNSPALIRAIAADSSASSSGTSSRANVVATTASGALEELVDDLDLLGARAEARERVDEALQAVVALDDLLGRPLAERVRLVVERRAPARRRSYSTSRRPCSRTPSCSNANGRSGGAPGSAAIRARELRAAVRGDEPADPLELLVGRARVPAAHRRRSRRGARGARRSMCSSSPCTASPISVAASPPCAALRRRGAARPQPGDALGVVAVRAALEQGERAVGQPAHPVQRGGSASAAAPAGRRRGGARPGSRRRARAARPPRQLVAAAPAGRPAAQRSTRTSDRAPPRSSSSGPGSPPRARPRLEPPSTQPIGVARRRPLRVDRAGHDQAVDGAGHRHVVEAGRSALLRLALGRAAPRS